MPVLLVGGAVSGFIGVVPVVKVIARLALSLVWNAGRDPRSRDSAKAPGILIETADDADRRR
jgi:hypothetical protein